MTLGKYCVFLCSQEFSCIFWDSGFGLIQENACLLAFTAQLMDGKLPEFQRFPCVFSHFLGQSIRVFFSAHWLTLFAPFHLLSHDQLATNIQWTKAHSLSQSEKQTQLALLILKVIYLNCVAVFPFYRRTTIHVKYEGNFPLQKTKLLPYTV